MARYQGLGVNIEALQGKLRSTMEKRGFKIERILEGSTSFLIEYKRPGIFGANERFSVKGVPNNFIVSGIGEDDEEIWFIVEDIILALAANPEAFRSHTERVPAIETPPPSPRQNAESTAQAKVERPILTSCTKCGAPLKVTQEDLIVTCRYCGFTISTGTSEEIKMHSMLENHLLTQQAAEAAKKFMDKGLFRVGVSRDAKITGIKLRYIPFWVFITDAETSFKGTTGTGFSGEMRQVQDALSSKRESKFKRFGKILQAGASAFMEAQQKNRRPRAVSYTFSSHYIWPILGRKTMISEIKYYDVPAAKKIPFDVGKIPKDADFLNTELNEEEAKTRIIAEVEAKERLVAGGKVDVLESCNTQVETGEGELIHAPIWFVNYNIKGENYAILVDGCDGKVLGGGRPLVKIV
ncbi:MAG: hypothetical protein JSV51_02265 [Candidatus Bathyarchaeota archaeon]|nr:MAG: hypothetical protein JSV51_02265 [Candidatus Bathyarchaeota archaeon]